VIDDELAKNELHLLRLCPLAWVSAEQETAFEKMPTLHGDVTLRFRLSRDQRSLEVTFDTKWHGHPPKVILHTPPIRHLSRVVVNGRQHSAAREIAL
jgi:hypothetical protein